MNEQLIKILNGILEHLEYYNNMAPFPVFDTGYIEDVKKKIKEMENTDINYDELPVAACKYCNSLHIQSDEVENDICMRCGATNEIVVYKDIYEYKEKVKKDETEY